MQLGELREAGPAAVGVGRGGAGPAAVGGVRVEAGVAQQNAERLEDALLVVDDENGRRTVGDHVSTAREEEGVDAGRRDGSARGSTTVKRVPLVPLSRNTRPRCASMARW